MAACCAASPHLSVSRDLQILIAIGCRIVIIKVRYSVCLSTVLPTARTALRSTDGTLAGWSQLLIVIFHFFITSPVALAAHETRKEHFKPPATSSSVDPALSIEAFYLGNFKGRDGVPRPDKTPDIPEG